MKEQESSPIPLSPDWFRFRRLRRSAALRALHRETQLRVQDLIWPLFVQEGITHAQEVESMPGVLRYPEQQLGERVVEAWEAGIRGVLLFGVPQQKDSQGADTWNPDGLMARMVRRAREAQPEMLVITDNCFCGYTEHGHCGVLDAAGHLDNDASLRLLVRQALTAAQAGAGMVAPSGMLDGQVAVLRTALDEAGYGELPIMSYAAKFASAFYGPFRDAVESGFQGTRDGYQLGAANGREAVAEALEDEQQGADILMVKPALPYLDVLAALRQASYRPLAAYQVSGEYAMIKHAALAGGCDERALVLESLLACKRAGADLVISYFAPAVAAWLR